jgi:hypothetical protein
MKTYNGQTISVLRPEAQLAVRVFDFIFQSFGDELCITWTNGGMHLSYSCHYKNRAFDFLPPKKKENEEPIMKLGKIILGKDYDVINEFDKEKPCGHCEWDPK